MLRKSLAQTKVLTFFVIRRDRIRIPIWIISIVAFTLLVVLSFTSLYGTEQERLSMAETMLNPAMTAMVGIGYGLDNYTIGAMMAHQMLLLSSVTVGIMSILLIARHTRGDEEEGRIELIRSLPSGRLSTLLASVIVLFGVNVLLAMLLAVGLFASGVDSIDLEGSLLYGAVMGATGIFFTAVTALFAQLSESSRGTVGLSMIVLGIAYLVRAIGDVSNETLSWFSPFGWVTRTETYVTNIWWPLLLLLMVSIVLFAVAFYLSSIRDLQAGFLPSKPGRKHASPFLQGPVGLVVRLQRTAIISWAIGMFVLGASYGSVLGDLDSFFEEIDMMEELLQPISGVSLTEQFITMLMSVIAMIATIPPLMILFRLKGEEIKNRMDSFLSQSISRYQLAGSYFLVSLVVGFFMLSFAALGMGSVGTTVMNNEITLLTFYQAAIVYLPAMWCMIGLAVLFVGFKPSWSVLTWLYLGFSFIAVYLGGLFQFPEWVLNLSPYAHIPKLPVEDMSFIHVIILIVLALLVAAAGFVGYRRRDITG
ncbi:ABC transporter permease [Halobacillus andaensis]|uniref:ABC transporter permease n=1 Tax=Halobacillus andaensis TaxID=1176239 RepID=A0A917ET00_HALAA|nr:ABC transporter permease [Halobacillus andaensis]MBP2003177.1 ABC-2 type transport system permease protein [Halobacillus andaensis]GGF08602.1 ABC transporter permease [Halobacillus andaensis]